MIAISAMTAATLYLGVTLIILLGMWTYHHYQSRKKKIVTLEQALRICEYCHFAYLAGISKAISKCPQCQCLNKTNGQSK